MQITRLLFFSSKPTWLYITLWCWGWDFTNHISALLASKLEHKEGTYFFLVVSRLVVFVVACFLRASVVGGFCDNISSLSWQKNVVFSAGLFRGLGLILQGSSSVHKQRHQLSITPVQSRESVLQALSLTFEAFSLWSFSQWGMVAAFCFLRLLLLESPFALLVVNNILVCEQCFILNSLCSNYWCGFYLSTEPRLMYHLFTHWIELECHRKSGDCI